MRDGVVEGLELGDDLLEGLGPFGDAALELGAALLDEAMALREDTGLAFDHA